MSWFTKEVKIVVLFLTLVASGLLVAVQYTELCSLQAVTLNGQKVENWESELGLVRSRGILHQPLDSLADALFARQGVRHVAINYFLPNTLHVITTDLSPVCYVHDDVSGTLFGLDETARVVPLESDIRDWELPVLTGVRIRLLFTQCADARVSLVVPQLLELRAQRPDFFRLISEISFTNPEYLTIAISGLPCTVHILPLDLMARMDDFITFMEHYKAEPFGASSFDLRYDNMIVRVAQPEKKAKDSAKIAGTSNPPKNQPELLSKLVVVGPQRPVVERPKAPEPHRRGEGQKTIAIHPPNHPTGTPKLISTSKPIPPSGPLLPLAPKKTGSVAKQNPKPKKVPVNGR